MDFQYDLNKIRNIWKNLNCFCTFTLLQVKTLCTFFSKKRNHIFNLKKEAAEKQIFFHWGSHPQHNSR